MPLNPSIILAGQQPNFLATIDQANRASAFQGEVQNQNAFRAMQQQHGPGILAGNPESMNAFARFDAPGALGVQAQRQSMEISAERLKLAKEEGARATQEFLAKADARQAEEAKKKALLLYQSVTPYVQSGDLAGLQGALRSKGITEDQIPQDMNQAMERMLELEGGLEMFQTAKATFAPAPSFRQATPEEASARNATGGQFGPDQRFYPDSTPTGMKMVSDGKGGFTLETNVPTGSGGKSGGTSPLLGTGAFIDAIDGALNDPALDFSTGALELLQNVPGSPMKRFQGRQEQISGQAFIEARAALKGQGVITDYESARAEAAATRAKTALNAEDYRDALLETRQILVEAMQRPQGWIDTRPGQIMQMNAGQISGLLQSVETLSNEELSAARKRMEQIKEWGDR